MAHTPRSLFAGMRSLLRRRADRPRRRGRGLRAACLGVEPLEERALPSVFTITGTAASYLASPGVANQVTLSADGGVLTLADPAEAITLAGDAARLGCTGNGTSTITCPANLTSLTIDTVDGGDRVTVRPLGIPAAVNVVNAGGLTDLAIDDGADGVTRQASLSATTFAGPSLATVNFTAGQLASLTITGGSGDNTFNVPDTPAGGAPSFRTTLNSGTGFDAVNVQGTTGPLLVQGVAGRDLVILGSAAPIQGGTVAGLRGPVAVANAGGFTDLVIDDGGDLFGADATLDAGAVTGLAPAPITFAADELGSLTVNGGRGGNRFTVADTGAAYPTTLKTGRGDAVTVAHAGGTLQVLDPDGSDAVTAPGGADFQRVITRGAVGLTADTAGALAAATDVDAYQFTLNTGGWLTAGVTRPAGSLLDSRLALLGTDSYFRYNGLATGGGGLLAASDDQAPGDPDPLLSQYLLPGLYTLQVASAGTAGAAVGAYLLSTAFTPDANPYDPNVNLPHPVQVGDNPQELIAADFNRDGVVDLATANHDSGDVSVLLGVGDGTFRPELRVAVSPGDHPGRIAAADLNGDGRLDLAALDPTTGMVSILLGVGDGTFRRQGDVPASDPLVAGLFAAPVQRTVTNQDFNRDGHPDVAHLVSPGQPAGAFANFLAIDIGLPPYARAALDYPPVTSRLNGPVVVDTVATKFQSVQADRNPSNPPRDTPLVGDFNGDGVPDVIEVNLQGQILLRLGVPGQPGTFAPPVPVNGAADPVAQVVIVSTDPLHPQLAAIALGSDLVYLFSGAVAADHGVRWAMTPLPGLTGNQPARVAAGDLQGTGRNDLVVADGLLGELSIYLNTGDGRFRRVPDFKVGITVSDVIVTDLNGDGRADILVTDQASGDFGVLLNRGLPAGTVGFDPEVRYRAGLPDKGYGVIESAVSQGGNATFDGVLAQLPAHPTGADLVRLLKLPAFHQGQLTPDAGLNALLDGVLAQLPASPTPAQFAQAFGLPLSNHELTPSFLLNVLLDGMLSRLPASPTPDQFAQAFTVPLYDHELTQNPLLNAVIDQELAALPASPTPAQLAALLGVPLVNGGLIANPLLNSLIDGFLARLPAAPTPEELAAAFVIPLYNHELTPDPLVNAVLDSALAALPAAPTPDQFAQAFSLPLAPTGQLLPPIYFTYSQLQTDNAVVGDFTGDGTPDVVVSNRAARDLVLLRGVPGTGRFADAQPGDVIDGGPPAPADANIDVQGPGAVVTGDFNGDGKPDLAFINEVDHSIWIETGDGRGHFTHTFTVDAGRDPTGLTAVDVTGDGVLDLLVGNSFGDLLELVGEKDPATGKGDGRFRPPDSTAGKVAVATLDGQHFVLADQAQDQVVAQQGVGGTVVVSAAAAVAEPATQAALVLQQYQQGILAPGAVAEVVVQGTPYLVVANGGENDVLIYRGRGDGTFDPNAVAVPAGTDPVGLTVAYLRSRTVPDVVVANKGSNDVSVLFGTASGGAWTLTAGPRLQSGGLGPTSVLVEDVTGPAGTPDGTPDLVVSNGQSGNVSVIPGVGNGFFNDGPTHLVRVPTPGEVFPLPGSPAGGAVLDAGAGGVFLISDLGGAGTSEFVGTGGVPEAAVEADLTRDGFPDLLVANDNGVFALLPGTANGFGAPEFFATDFVSPSDLALAAIGNGTFSLFATQAGVEAVTRLTFDLGTGIPAPSSVTPAPALLGNGGAGSGADRPQVADLAPLNGSTVAIVAVLVTGSRGADAVEDDAGVGPGLLAVADRGAAVPLNDAGPAADTGPDPAALANFLSDLDRVIGGMDLLAELPNGGGQRDAANVRAAPGAPASEGSRAPGSQDSTGGFIPTSPRDSDGAGLESRRAVRPKPEVEGTPATRGGGVSEPGAGASSDLGAAGAVRMQSSQPRAAVAAALLAAVAYTGHARRSKPSADREDLSGPTGGSGPDECGRSLPGRS